MKLELRDDRSDFYIAADVSATKVIFALAALERAWAYTYFYLAAFDLIKALPKGVETDLRTISEMDQPRALASWALQCELQRASLPWPAGVPTPDSKPDPAGLTKRANDHFFYVFTFMFLHEVAHIQNGDVGDNTRVRTRRSASNSPQTAGQVHSCCSHQITAYPRRNSSDAALGSPSLSRCSLRSSCINIAAVMTTRRSLSGYVTSLTSFAQKLTVRTRRDLPLYLAASIIQAHLMNAQVEFPYSAHYPDVVTYLIAAHRAIALENYL